MPRRKRNGKTRGRLFDWLIDASPSRHLVTFTISADGNHSLFQKNKITLDIERDLFDCVFFGEQGPFLVYIKNVSPDLEVTGVYLSQNAL